MAVVGAMAFIVVPAFLLGVLVSMVIGFWQLWKWHRRDQPKREGWYHTWKR